MKSLLFLVAIFGPAVADDFRQVTCPGDLSFVPAIAQCAGVTNAAFGDHCGSCNGNIDCVTVAGPAYHCSGPRDALRCVLNEKCIQYGCMCHRKRDCCDQPHPVTGEDPDLRCRIPPPGHNLHYKGSTTQYCLPISYWEQ